MTRHVPQPAGLVLRPFRALRYALPDAALAAVTAPPGAAAPADAGSFHISRLILPRGAGGSERLPAPVLAAAGQRLRDWRELGVLARDPQPALYVYEQRTPAGEQRGLLGALELPDPQQRLVLPHEHVAPGAVAERLAVAESVQADLEPVFLLYDGGGPASALVHEVTAGHRGPPLVDLVTENSERHRLWAVTQPGDLDAVARDLAPRRAVIADGHHRYATYLQRQLRHHAAGHGQGPWDLGLVLLVDARHDMPAVRPVHRLLAGVRLADVDAAAARLGQGARLDRLDGRHGLDGPDGEAALAALAAAASPAVLLVEPDATPPGLMRLLRADPGGRAGQRLGVALLHDVLLTALRPPALEPVAVRLTADLAEVLSWARSGAGVAAVLPDVPAAEVVAAALDGTLLPRKSTHFLPKPRSGLVLRSLER